MYTAALVRVAKISNILVSTCFAAFGIFLIATPTCPEIALRFSLGGLIAISGVCKLIGYFSKDLYRLAFQYDLPLGITFIVLGAAMLLCSQDILQTICIVLGVAILIEGIYKIKTSFDAKKFGIRMWFALFILAVIACAFGVILLFRPGGSRQILIILLGIGCVENGILNFVEKVCTVKVVKHQIPD